MRFVSIEENTNDQVTFTSCIGMFPVDTDCFIPALKKLKVINVLYIKLLKNWKNTEKNVGKKEKNETEFHNVGWRVLG